MGASILICLLSALAIWLLFSDGSWSMSIGASTAWKYYGCILIGLSSGIGIGEATEYFTSYAYTPTTYITQAGPEHPHQAHVGPGPAAGPHLPRGLGDLVGRPHRARCGCRFHRSCVLLRVGEGGGAAEARRGDLHLKRRRLWA